MSRRRVSIVRWLARGFPHRFRTRYLDDLEALYRDLAAAGRPARGIAWNLLVNLVGTRWDDLRLARERRRPPTVSTPRKKETSMLDSLLHDLRFGLRTLRRTPLLTLAALLTLALGIGGTAAIFSVIHGVLLKPMSSPTPERVAFIFGVNEQSPMMPISYDNFRDLETGATRLEHLAAIRPQSVAVTGDGGPPERVRGMFITAGFLSVLGERPALGRGLLPGEAVAGGDRAAVLGYGFWQRRYGGDPAVIGRPIRLNNEDHIIVGVMEQTFRFPFDTTEVWLSAHSSPGRLDRAHPSFFVLGRLRADATILQAEAEIKGLSAQLAEAYPEVNRSFSTVMVAASESLVGSRFRTFVLLLQVAVAMVLLIGVANVASLQLARATQRGREMAVRTALGSRRSRLVRQLLTESLALSLLGGGLGILVAIGGLRLLTALDPRILGSLFAVQLDLPVLAFGGGVTLITGILCGVAPALRGSRTDLMASLRGRQVMGGGRQRSRLRANLVVAQIAMAVVLLIGAGLLLRSFAALQQVDVGFQRDDLLTLQMRIPANKYEGDEQIIGFYDRALERVSAVPGVRGAASAQGMPFAGDEWRISFLADGLDPGPEVEVPRISGTTVSESYFTVLGIPLLEGRVFEASDRLGTQPVAVISRRVAARAWPGERAVGRTFRLRGEDPLYRVIGVVDDVRSRGFSGDRDPMAYLSARQVPSRFATIAVRVGANPLDFAEPVRAAIWAIDPDQPIWEVMSQNQRIDSWMSSERLATSLLVVFSSIALLLAAIGIAGMVAYMVAQRTGELGIRLALGARRGQILTLVMRQGLRLLVAGAALGMAGAVLLNRALRGILFGVGSLDPFTFIAAVAVLSAVVALACFLPARHASRIDPVRALRRG